MDTPALEEFQRNVLMACLSMKKPYDYVVQSMEDLLKSRLPRMFVSSSIQAGDHTISFENMSLGHCEHRDEVGCLKKSSVRECIMLGTLFSISVLVDIVIVSKTGLPDEQKVVVNQRVPVMKVPAMVGMFDGKLDSAGERHTAIDGCFLVNGKSRQICTQQQLATNTCFVFVKDQQLSMECRSLRDSTPWSSTSTLTMTFKKTSQLCTFAVPFFNLRNKKPCKMGLQDVFWLMDEETTLESITAMAPDMEELLFLNWDSSRTPQQMMAHYTSAMQKNAEGVRSCFQYQFLPHIEGKTTQREHTGKVQFLFSALRRVIAVAQGRAAPHSKDDLRNKQLLPAGALVGTLLSQCLRTTLSEIVRKVDAFAKKHATTNISCFVNDLFAAKSLSSRVKSAFSSGNMSLYTDKRHFRAQEMLNLPSALVQYRQVQKDLHKESKSKTPRQLDRTSWGFLCPVSTVDGEHTGAQNCLTCACDVTRPVDAVLVATIVDRLVSTFNAGLPAQPAQPAQVFVNGSFVCFTREPVELVLFLRKKRRCADFPRRTSVVYHSVFNEVAILCNEGRFSKPVYIVSELPRLFSADGLLLQHLQPTDNLFQFLEKHGVVEWLDASEANHSGTVVAPSLHEVMSRPGYYTHAHLHSYAMFADTAQRIPFSNHNAACRNIYWSLSQSKALIGQQDMNEARNLSTTVMYNLASSQRPVCRTFAEDFASLRSPNMTTPGVNCIVAVAAEGNNIEDSLIVKRQALQRGLFQYFASHPYKIACDICNDVRVIVRPTPETVRNMMPRGIYSKLQANGLPLVGTRIEAGEVVIGCVERVSNLTSGDEEWEDRSLKSTTSGVVSKVFRNCNHMKTVVTVVVDALKSPVAGDKLCSRHGQKGTVGAIQNDIDMPFCESDGLVPDLVFNPSGMSRMTMGQLLESAYGKVAMMKGKTSADATGFVPNSMETLEGLLKKHGMHSDGTQRFRGGRTGRLLKMRLYCGIVHYGLMKHFVGQKIQCRSSRGPVNAQTRQPVGGRRRGGGGRFGEMESDALVSHGSSAMLHSVMNISSDCSERFICTSCQRSVEQSGYILLCRHCGSRDVAKVDSTTTGNLLFSTLQTLGIDAKFELE